MSLPTAGYDAHQRLRAKVVRLLAKKNYDRATAALYDGALAQLQAGEQASGVDLAVYMVDVYAQQHLPVDATRTEHVVHILKATDGDWWRQKLLQAVTRWAEAQPAGTAHAAATRALRAQIGQFLWSAADFRAAEGHLVAALPSPAALPSVGAGEPSPAVLLGQMSVDWLLAHAQKTAETYSDRPSPPSKEASVRIEAGRFALRGILILLVAGQVPAALAFLDTFLRTLVSKPEASSFLLPVTPNPKTFVPPPGVTPPARLAPPLLPGAEPSYEQPLWLTGNADVNFAQMLLGLIDCAYRYKGEGPAFATHAGGKPAVLPAALKTSYSVLVRQYQNEGIAVQVDELVATVRVFPLSPPAYQHATARYSTAPLGAVLHWTGA